ncbi:DMT family transporter [Paenibacillus camerounensis]|uniref:DMT family transporter n=1 Tax=Paenibacillus camerounensis TaxID=1243663 RepID=UPI0005A6B78C|nr:multidrug efflux SMR transporter [Paenibacillus camerounensis]
MNRSWLYVLIGACFEVLWVMGLKHADDVLTWTGTVIAIVLSFGLLIRAVAAKLPVGTAYAVFTGLGTSGTVLVEMLLFGEEFSLIKILLIALLLTGVLGLKMVTKDNTTKRGVA